MKFRRKKKFKNLKKGHKSSSLLQEWGKELLNDNSNNDVTYNEEVTPKWYEEFADTPEKTKDLPSHEIDVLREEAKQVLKNESALYHTNKGKGNQGTDQAWVNTVLKKGTSSDKVAAYVLKIQESPVFNLSSLTTLVNMVRISKKEFSFVIDALAELFITDLLQPSIKLRPFEKQPLDRLPELSSGNAITRRRRLAFWAFEDELRKLYIQMIQSLNLIAKDSVDANKEKAVSILYKLLVSHPEQEDVILKMLVNKLGDPSRKVVCKVIYSLTQLLRVHEGMKQIVMDEVEKLLFRPNMNVKTQYYAICFLSQFHFTIDDDQVACNLISIFFSFFRACVKKGDVNSRMLSSLLMGLNRAYPYAKKKMDTLTEHINTLYKLVHLSNFNIGLHCLSILFQISNSTEDRFYSALYKKLSDLSLATSSHQAIFINLLYRALTRDNNIGRIRTFIKRILQLCKLMPVPLTCGLLYLVSSLIEQRKTLSSNELLIHPLDAKYDDVNDDDDDGDEHYVDVDKQSEIEGEIKENIDEDKDVDSKTNVDKKESKPCASWYHTVFQKKKKHGFDPLVRNPAYAEGELAVYTELNLLARHFHPTVALFASNILEDNVITYTGDPLADFTLVRFIERFVFKNPKKIAPGTEVKGPDPVLAQRKYYMPSGAKALATNSKLYLEQKEEDVPIDELFLYRYLHQRQQLGHHVTKKESDDDSDVDSVASEEFEEMLNNMVSKKGDIDFADDIGENLSKRVSKKSKPKYREDEEDDDDDDDFDNGDFEGNEEEEIDDEEIDSIDDDDGAERVDKNSDDEDLSDLDLDEIDDSDEEVIDFDDSENEEIDDGSTVKSKRNKKVPKVNMKKLKKDISSFFAPAEHFSEMLEETGTTGYKVGTAHALSNKDKAATKQLEWEMKRNDWMHGNKRRKKDNFKNAKRRKR